MTMALKGVLLDLDNTLYVYEPCNVAGIKAAFKIYKNRNSISWGSFEKLYCDCAATVNRKLNGTAASHNRLLYFQEMLERLGQPVDVAFASKLFSTYWRAFMRHMKLDNDALQTIKFLKKHHIKIGLVTDLTTEIQFLKIQKLHLAPYLDAIVTSEEVGSEKPSSAPLSAALSKLGIRAKEAIMIGDNPETDIAAARAMGIPSVQIVRSDIPKSSKRPTFSVRTFLELQLILSNLID